MKVALVHDDLTQRGGAERVVLSLHRAFPEAPIFTTIYDPEATYPEFGECDVRTTGLQRIPGASRLNRALLPLYPGSFDRLVVKGYDLVISSTSRFAHGARVEGGVHVAYCHSPPRFLYPDEFGTSYFGPGGPAPGWARPALAPVLARIRRWDQRAAHRPDAYLANSAITGGRVERLYGRSATVVHPPVASERWVPQTGHPAVPAEPYYLVVSRLLAYKRVDRAIAACAALGRRLVIVGSGPARDALAAEAGPAVEFRGTVDDAELQALLGSCTALLQPWEEDLGLMPLEANAAGVPAVALAAGGAPEVVVDGVTGLLVPDVSTEALAAALRRVDSIRWDVTALHEHARAFDEASFGERLVAALDATLQARAGA